MALAFSARMEARRAETEVAARLTRRGALKIIGGTALGSAITLAAGTPNDPPSSAAPRPDGSWANWAGSQVSHPKRWVTPPTEQALVAEIRRATGTVRMLGAGHSWSPLVVTDDVLVSLEHLAGVIEHDAKTYQATLWAGTRLYDIGAILWECGQALVNQGDIDKQSLAGAIATSTHGTGATVGSFSSLVRGLRLVTADGEILECGRDRDSDIFHAGCTALGALGAITQVRMQNRSTYYLRERTYTMDLEEILRGLDRFIAENRHFEFWPFYKTPTALVKTLNVTDTEIAQPPAFDLPVDGALWTGCEVAQSVPHLGGVVQRLLMALPLDSERVDRSYRIFPSPRNVRFHEMEYELPARHGPECLVEILETVRRHDISTIFPMDYRNVAADDCWLSPFYGRDSVAISIHQYHKADYRQLFSLVEPIFWKYEGRPHWGKLHTLGVKQLAVLYPEWDAFQAVRRRLDPRGKFMNNHLRHIFGPT